MEKEIWRPIKGYEELYEVSNYGKVRTTKGRMLKQHINQFGYCKICLSKNGKQKEYAVHRLVATAFIPNVRGVEFVNHIDECKANNHVDNLEWVTARENNYHGTARERISETLKEHFRHNRHPRAKEVRCVETNQIYSSVRSAGRLANVDSIGISKCARGKQKTAGGFHWQYVNE